MVHMIRYWCFYSYVSIIHRQYIVQYDRLWICISIDISYPIDNDRCDIDNDTMIDMISSHMIYVNIYIYIYKIIYL